MNRPLMISALLLVMLSSCRLFGGSNETPRIQPEKDVSVTSDVRAEPDAGREDISPDTPVTPPDAPILPRPESEERATNGLIMLFEFKEGSGMESVDSMDETVVLEFSQPVVEWIPGRNGLIFDAPGSARTQTPHAGFYNTAVGSEQFTFEIWLKPQDETFSGPSRIFTISEDPNRTNFTFGQQGNRYAVRLHQNVPGRLSDLGYPMVETPTDSLVLAETHVVVTFDGLNIVVFQNGVKVADGIRTGSPKDWRPSFRISIADEYTDERFWAGTIYLIAAYDRVLSPTEIQQNFEAGSVR